jgi:ubiquinone/menaquinone biosynthesis C-methylase UbiE
MNQNNESEWYNNCYPKISITGDTSKVASKILHRFLEFGKSDYLQNRSILEIGVNNGEHLQFVKGRWGKYVALDIRVPHEDVLQQFQQLNVEFILGDAHKMAFPNDYFDEVIVSCVFHHLQNPKAAMTEIRRVLKVGGKAYILIPNDPGLGYRVVRHFTSVRQARKLNFETQLQNLHYSEHRNHFLSLINTAKQVFIKDEMRLRSFPFFFSWYDMNLLTRAQITKK